MGEWKEEDSTCVNKDILDDLTTSKDGTGLMDLYMPEPLESVFKEINILGAVTLALSPATKRDPIWISEWLATPISPSAWAQKWVVWPFWKGALWKLCSQWLVHSTDLFNISRGNKARYLKKRSPWCVPSSYFLCVVCQNRPRLSQSRGMYVISKRSRGPRFCVVLSCCTIRQVNIARKEPSTPVHWGQMLIWAGFNRTLAAMLIAL